MADFTIAITVPDDKVIDLLNALRAQYGVNQTTGAQLTPAEIRQKLAEEVRAILTDRYFAYKRKTAVIPRPGIT